VPRKLAPCGTDSAYQRHRRRGEPIDAACREAHNATRRKREADTDDDALDPRPIVALPGGSVRMPDAPAGDMDARAELLANMALVKKAMEAIAEADPLKIVQLSKRHSELVDELVRVTGGPSGPGAGPAGEADPVAEFFNARRAAGGATAAPRK